MYAFYSCFHIKDMPASKYVSNEENSTFPLSKRLLFERTGQHNGCIALRCCFVKHTENKFHVFLSKLGFPYPVLFPNNFTTRKLEHTLNSITVPGGVII